MKNIKIPLLIKIYGLIIFIITTFNIIFLDFVYAFHGFGKYFWIFVGIALLWILYSFSIFRYIKSPSKGNGILQKIFVILLFLLNLLNSFLLFEYIGEYSLIGIIPFIFILFVVSKISKINKTLENSETNISENTKNNFGDKTILQKILFIIGIIILFLLLLFDFFVVYGTYKNEKILTIVFLLLGFFNIYAIYKLIKNRNSPSKIKKELKFEYSEKPQEKGLLIIFGIFIFSLIIFYFSYYTKGYEFEKIPDSYFDDTKLYKNVDSKENGFNILEKYIFGEDFIYKEKELKFFISKSSKGDWKNPYENNIGKEYKKDLEIIESLKENKKYKDFEKEYKKIISNFSSGDYKKNKNIIFNIEQIKINDLYRKKRQKIYNSKIYIMPIRKYFSSLKGITGTTRNTIYNVLFYLKNNNEKKAIQYLVEDYKYGKLLIGGYNDIVGKIVGITSLLTNQDQIKYILSYYNLEKENLLYLKENIINSKSIKGAYKKMQIYEYNNMINPLKNTNLSKIYVENKFNGGDNFIEKIRRDFFNIDINLLKLNTIFLNGNIIKDISKNIYYYAGKENIDKNLAFCNIKKDLSKAEALKIIFLKKNGYFIIMGTKNCLSFRGYDKNFQEIQKQEKLILEKIDKQLKEIEKKEEKQKINPKILEFFRK